MVTEERVRAELRQNVGAHEEVRDPERPALGIAQYAGRDERRAVLHRIPRRLGRGERARLVGARRYTRHGPAPLEIDEHRLLETTALLHQVTREVEDAVVARQLVVAAESVLLSILREPVDEQVAVAPVADLAGRYPLEPIAIRPRIDEGAIVALRDRCATDHFAPAVSRRPRKSGSSRSAVPSVGAGAPPRFAQ